MSSISMRSECDLGDTAGVSSACRERQRRAAAARNASGRRRFVDPTTSEQDYSAAELEFMFAIQAYKASSGRNFPTWSEVLEVLVDLGYRKADEEGK
ncbi:MAG: hypothetical protein ACYC99_16390 [Candidatus Geothermincolia bacterium]